MEQKHLLSLLMSILTFIIFVILPLISLIQVNMSFSEFPELSHLRILTVANLLISASIGLGLTVLRFFISRSQEFSIKRTGLRLSYNGLILLLLISTFLISDLNVSIEGADLNFNFNGVIILLVIAWVPILLKHFYDLIFISKIRSSKYLDQGQQRIFDRLHVDCPKCKYTCRKEWKECPICNNSLSSL
jgi:hypothetical protein